MQLNTKSLLIAAVALLFVGEMLFQLVINASPSAPQQQNEGVEFLSAIMQARSEGLESLVLVDESTVQMLKQNGCSALRIGSEYSVKCNDSDFLRDVAGSFKLSFVVENVTTIRGTMPTYRKISLTLPFYVEPNKTVELKGTAYIKNGTVIEVTPNTLYKRNITSQENATILEVINTTYVYNVSFDDRNLFRDVADIKDVVFTNMTMSKAPFVSFIGSGYIIVDPETNSSEVLQYYPDAAFPTFEVTTDKKLDLPLQPKVVSEILLNTSIGIFKQRVEGAPRAGDTLPISIYAEVTGDVILNSSLSLLPQSS